MKKILIALLLISTNVLADEWFEMNNQAGGKIILTLAKCENGGETSKFVVSTMPSGDNITGCWYYFSGMVHIVWSSGRTSSFEPSSFTPKKSP